MSVYIGYRGRQCTVETQAYRAPPADQQKAGLYIVIVRFDVQLEDVAETFFNHYVNYGSVNGEKKMTVPAV